LYWGRTAEAPVERYPDLVHWFIQNDTRFDNVYDSKIRQFCVSQKLDYVIVSVPSEFRRWSPQKNVGITAGLEATLCSQDWVSGCNQMDLLIVPSTFSARMLTESGVRQPIVVIPESVDTKVFTPKGPDSTFRFETPINFLVVANWLYNGMDIDRKAVARTLQLFLKAFQGRKDVGLILKTQIHNLSTVDFYNTQNLVCSALARHRAGSYPKVYLVHGYLKPREMAALYRHPSVVGLLNFSCGEGFGRPIAEALCCGKPVLQTAWSGPLDFVPAEFLVNYVMGAVPSGLLPPQFVHPQAAWAYIKEEEAIGKMQELTANSSVWLAAAQSYASQIQQQLDPNRVYALYGEVFARASVVKF
jgi:glycosyltransferase involved in cell wall biosynthesis